MRWELEGKRFPSGAALFNHIVKAAGIVGEGVGWTARDQMFLIEDKAGKLLFRRQFSPRFGFNLLRDGG